MCDACECSADQLLLVSRQALDEAGPVLSTAALLLDQRARRQERRAAALRGSERRRRIDALSAAAGAIAMVRLNRLLLHTGTAGQAESCPKLYAHGPYNTQY